MKSRLIDSNKFKLLLDDEECVQVSSHWWLWRLERWSRAEWWPRGCRWSKCTCFVWPFCTAPSGFWAVASVRRFDLAASPVHCPRSSESLSSFSSTWSPSWSPLFNLLVTIKSNNRPTHPCAATKISTWDRVLSKENWLSPGRSQVRRSALVSAPSLAIRS